MGGSADVRIGWWNCGLFPARYEAADARALLIGEFICDWASKSALDLIFLGELPLEFFEKIERDTSERGFVGQHFAALDKDLKRSSRIGSLGMFAISDPTVDYHGPLIPQIGMQPYPVALHLGLQIGLDEAVGVNLFLVHMPSRRMLRSSDADRAHIAVALRHLIDDLSGRASFEHVVVMGDFNDNPFDTSMMKYLRSTRDRHHSRERGGRLFNPFWKELLRSEGGQVPLGTYRYSGRDDEPWHCFDQALFSASLLGSGSVSIVEGNCRIYRDQNLIAALSDKGNFVDHLPIEIELELAS